MQIHGNERYERRVDRPFDSSKRHFDPLPPVVSGQLRKRQLRKLLTYLGLICATLMVGTVAVFSYKVLRELILNNLRQQALLQVQKGVSGIDLWLATGKAEIATLANSPIVQTVDWRVVSPYFQAERKRLNKFEKLTLADVTGSAYNTAIGTSYNVTGRDWFQGAMHGKIHIADPIVSRSTGILQINIAAPIVRAGRAQPGGVVSGAVPVNQIIEAVNQLQQGSGSYAFALNSKGVPIAHPDRSLIGTPEKPAPSFLQSSNSPLVEIAQRMVNQQRGIELVNLDGHWQYVVYTPLQEVGWSIALVIPQQNIESSLYALNLLAGVFGAVLLIALIGAMRQAQLFEQTRLQAEQEALLNRLTLRIRESLDLSTIIQTTFKELATLIELDQVVFDRVVFGWYQPAEHELDVVGDSQLSWHDSIVVHRYHTPIDLERTLQQQAAIVLKPGPDLDRQPLELKSSAYVAFPLPVQEGVQTGYLLGLHNGQLKQEDWELLSAVADQLAIAITQAHLYKQTQTQVELLNDTLSKLNNAQLQLVQSEKMSSLGQLVAGIAHEINNPVNFIYGNLLHATQYSQDLLELVKLYQMHFPNPPQRIQDKTEYIELDFLSEDLPKLLGSMQVGAQRIREIVQSLRVFSRLDEAEVKNVDVHEGIDSTLMILQNRLKEKPDRVAINVIKQYGELPLVECYAGQLNQVFMNVLSNAIDALEDSLKQNRLVEPCFDHSHHSSDNHCNNQCDHHSSSPQPPSRVPTAPHPTIWIRTRSIDATQIEIRIADNGMGIDEATQRRLFEPFFTTKPVGKGTGMGLAISYQIVTERHQGQFQCISAPDQGTEFVITIPIHQ